VPNQIPLKMKLSFLCHVPYFVASMYVTDYEIIVLDGRYAESVQRIKLAYAIFFIHIIRIIEDLCVYHQRFILWFSYVPSV